MGVEPIGDRKTCHPPVLKITECILTRCENFVRYLILPAFTRKAF
jgi:hypothetical protein